jgi:LacI family transcriptional regulator
LVRRVEDAIVCLDYIPNEVARSLKAKHTFIIGVIVPDVSDLFFNDIIRGAETKARAYGYSLVLCDSHEDPVQERDLLTVLIRRRLDGILLASAQSNLAGTPLVKRWPPIVCFDRHPEGFKGPVVVIDNELAAYRAARHLIDLGHERVAAIAGPETTVTGSGRIKGFRKAIQGAHLSLPKEYVRPGDFTREGGYRAAREILQLPQPPTAVLACNSHMMLGLMRALKDLGLVCPRDVSVCGFDDIQGSELFSPSLTIVVQPSYEMGELATEMLLNVIKAKDQHLEGGERNRVVLKAELRVRESTAPPLGLSGCPQQNGTLPSAKSSEATQLAALEPPGQPSKEDGQVVFHDQISEP